MGPQEGNPHGLSARAGLYLKPLAAAAAHYHLVSEPSSLAERLGCGLSIVASLEFLPYPRSLPRPHACHHDVVGIQSFRISPQFGSVADDFPLEASVHVDGKFRVHKEADSIPPFFRVPSSQKRSTSFPFGSLTHKTRIVGWHSHKFRDNIHCTKLQAS